MKTIKTSWQRTISFIVLLIAYIYFFGAINNDYSWSFGWGLFWTGILTFVYGWIIYHFHFNEG